LALRSADMGSTPEITMSRRGGETAGRQFGWFSYHSSVAKVRYKQKASKEEFERSELEHAKAEGKSKGRKCGPAVCRAVLCEQGEG